MSLPAAGIYLIKNVQSDTYVDLSGGTFSIIPLDVDYDGADS